MSDAADGVRIREATDADFPRMVPIINAAYAIEEFLEGDRVDLEHLRSLRQTGTFLVVEDEAENIAATVYVETDGERGYFGVLAVAPSHQGHGLGRRMVRQAENFARARECRYIELTVLSLRTDLPPFYESLGYAEVRREPFKPRRALKGGVACHAIVMSKML